MHYVYLLRDAGGKVYAGYTENLKKRIEYHDTGNVRTTKNYREPRLVWYCAFRDKGLALEFERYLKKGSGHAFVRKHLLN